MFILFGLFTFLPLATKLEKHMIDFLGVSVRDLVPLPDELLDECFILKKLSGKKIVALDIHGELEESEFLVFFL
jgi:hypothetical protein